MTASSQASTSLQPYGSRVGNFAKNAAARNILETMERKQSNLCVSVDVTKKKDLLDIVDAVGEAVIMVKTHIDIVEDFDIDLVVQLTALAKKHDFVIFEDRKFADIGNTVSLQYAAGVHKIASWSDITNAHLVPGTGIIDGLAKVGEPLGRGLLLLAEMSSKGTLAAGEYTRANVEAAYNNESGFVMGFIAMGRVDDKYAPADKPKRDFLVLTPGVGLDVTGDAMGQQYRTPDQVIYKSGCDVIIVGRGIYGALTKESDDGARQAAVESVRKQGKRYREAGWEAYLKRINHGQQNGHVLRPNGVLANGYANGHVNGHANGHANGVANGHAHGSKLVNGPRYANCGQVANGTPIAAKGPKADTPPQCKPYRPTGVGIVFAYGSLIFKPPPHTIGRTVGYVKGYARRFAQSSNDHRGTPEHPGRVATLVRSSDWAKFIPDDDSPEGDIVWGVAWTIDPRKENEVRAYLDDREKNGYTAQSTPVYGLDENGNETVLMDDALLYVGLPDNEAFVGPAKSLVSLADHIFSCEGPSGRNDDYVLKLATACRLLSSDVADSHLFTLERLLLELRAKHGMSMGIVNQKDQREVRAVV